MKKSLRSLYGVFTESLRNLHGVTMEEDGVCEKLNWKYFYVYILDILNLIFLIFSCFYMTHFKIR